jgi:hypothetical protein
MVQELEAMVALEHQQHLVRINQLWALHEKPTIG